MRLTTHSRKNEAFEKVFVPIFKRLASLVKSQFGCELGYTPLISPKIKDYELLKKSLKKDQAFHTETKVYFPVFVNNELLGAADVLKTPSLKDTDIDRLNGVISMVLESGLASLNRIEVLDQLQEQLDILSHSQNVYRINDYPHLHKIVPEIFSKTKSTRFNLPCLIEGQSIEDVQRMAREIHRHSHRFAMVPFKDLDFATRTSSEEINKIGPTSLIIEDITRLTEPEQVALYQFLEDYRGKESPQLIIGSALPYKELLANPKISTGLVKRATVAYIKMEKPFKDYDLSDIVSFFYESLTGQSPT